MRSAVIRITPHIAATISLPLIILITVNNTEAPVKPFLLTSSFHSFSNLFERTIYFYIEQFAYNTFKLTLWNAEKKLYSKCLLNLLLSLCVSSPVLFDYI